MIDPDLPIAAYAEAFQSMPVGAVVIRRAIPNDAVAALRERMTMRPFREMWLADRGRYAHCDDLDEPELVRAVERAASIIADGRAAVASARCLRLVHGDYALLKDDQPLEGVRSIDATVDLSAGSSSEAQVVYSIRGHNFFAVPQLSGSVALVERRPGVRRYDRYLNRAMGDRVVYRLRLVLIVDEAP